MGTVAPAAVPVWESKLARKPGKLGIAIFGLALIVGFVYAAANLLSDLSTFHPTSVYPFVLLGVALLIALGFEFVNGFHDTANAVATVIYTHSLEPHTAVVWSGMWNFFGVLSSTGAVAFGIITLLPVELILQVGSGPGFAMVFALLTAAILWNLGTWYFGLPSSSSHTLVGSIIGVGIANQLMSVHRGTSGVDWSQAVNVAETLLVSPIVGFVCAALLLLLSKLILPYPKLYESPKSAEPPPWWIRLLLIGTCTGVSFAHGSNDGQKGMGLIMLILVGTVPTAYALNHAITRQQTTDFVTISRQTADTLHQYVSNAATIGDPRDQIRSYVSTRTFTPNTMLALQQLVKDLGNEAGLYEQMRSVPEQVAPNLRNEMYLASEALRLMKSSGDPKLAQADWAILDNYRKHIDVATKFIPAWVKVAVAMALGLGTMVGWKRIVVTVGEKIGKQHLTYAQGAAAEITAMATIWAADHLGLPVSTTHVLSSGVGGTMAANHSGLQRNTVRSLLIAWVLTLPSSVVLAAFLYWLFRQTM
jgi:inorganic phosphate transporter, PiT family